MKRKDLVNIINNYDISRFCDKCEIEKTKMVKHPDKLEWLLCPRCGWTVSIFAGKSKLVDTDEGTPMLEVVGEHKEQSIEDKLIGELKRKGMSDIKVGRL